MDEQAGSIVVYRQYRKTHFDLTTEGSVGDYAHLIYLRAKHENLQRILPDIADDLRL